MDSENGNNEHSAATDGYAACANTDTELWRRDEGDFYSPSVHVTADGLIGINVGGKVHVRSVEQWHRLATTMYGENSHRCAKCRGTGSVHRSWNGDYVDCPACDGKGF